MIKTQLRLSSFKLILILLLIYSFNPSQNVFAQQDNAQPAAATNQEDKGYTIAPPSAWVEVTDGDEYKDSSGKEVLYGLEYLLVDTQINEYIEDTEYYYRYMNKVTDSVGIEDASHLEITYNPKYEKLIIHNIHILRDDKIIDGFSESKIHLLQREEELEDYIIDGEKTLNITLSSVRVGDIIDYSFTIVGRNPTFADRVFNRFTVGFDVPINKTKLRLILPKDKVVNIRQYHMDEPHEVLMKDKWKELVWDIDYMEGVYNEEALPSWYYPYGRMQITDFLSWDELKTFIAKIFDKQVDTSKEIDDLVTKIQSETDNVDEQIIKALRFVQKEISYTSMSIESGGYVPKKPSVVMKERYGDCKDTSLLLVTILKGLGIEAYPAFVNTYLHEHLADYLPSPWMFDHVIVMLKHNGKTYWFDPTRSSEGGTLATAYQAKFGKALVLDNSSGLTDATISSYDIPSMYIRSVFDFNGKMEGPVSLTVDTIFRHDFCDYCSMSIILKLF